MPAPAVHPLRRAPLRAAGCRPLAASRPAERNPALVLGGEATRAAAEEKRHLDAAAVARAEIEWLEFRREIASLRFEWELLKFSLKAQKAVHHSHFQLRDEIGRFADEGGVRLAAAGPLLSILAGLLRIAPHLPATRVEGALRRATQLSQRLREIDRRWRPKHLPEGEDVEAQMRRAEEIARQAEQRLAEYASQSPEQLIAQFRAENQHPDFSVRRTKGLSPSRSSMDCPCSVPIRISTRPMGATICSPLMPLAAYCWKKIQR